MTSTKVAAKPKEYRLVLETRSYVIPAKSAADAYASHNWQAWGERCVEVLEVKS